MKINAKKSFLILLACGLMFGFAYVQYNLLTSYPYVIMKNWSVDLPLKCEVEYENDESHSVFGDGFRYRVLSYDEPIDISGMLPAHIFDMSEEDEKKIAEIVETLGVPKEHLPQDIGFIYYQYAEGTDQLFMLITSDATKVYVIESFY